MSLLYHSVILRQNPMHPQDFFPFIFLGVVFLILGSFIFKIIKNGGFKAAMFGAPIERTVGDVTGSSPSRIMSVALRVHVLGGESPDKAVGLEFVAKSFASYQMMPVSLSKVQARKLITLLESATQST
jgi:hypothetical protein